MVRLGLALISLLGVASAGTAFAQSARELFESGRASYRVGDYEVAIEKWSKAYELDPQPLLQYNLGQAYERLGRLEEAIAATESYLADTSPDDPNRGDAVGRHATMTRRLEQTAIVVRSDVEGAIIEIDGEYKARTPRVDPIRVKPGQHTVIVRHGDLGEFRTRGSAVNERWSQERKLLMSTTPNSPRMEASRPRFTALRPPLVEICQPSS